MKRTRRIPLTKRALRRCARPAIASPRWRPLSLAWRKLSRSVARPARAPRAFVRNAWSPHFTLQLKLAFTASAKSWHFSTSTRFVSAIVRRQGLTQLTALRRILHWSRDSDRVRLDRIVRDVAARERVLRTSTRTEVRKQFRTRTLPLRMDAAVGRPAEAQPDLRRSRSLLFADTIAVHRSREPFRTARHVNQVTTTRRTELVLAARSPHPAQVASRPPELVWRIEPGPFAPDAIESNISAAMPAAVAFGGPAALHVEQMTGAHELPAAGRLDPALLDRVAEDVIGRVERRIRIERERRGV